MKDEIKEILDKLKDGNWYEELDLTGTMWIELRWKETHLLLDYITNLQEENEELKAELQEANDSATWWSNRFKAVERDNKNYKSRNGKAIRYIERCRDYHRDIHKEERIFPDEITSLLMILNGGDEEC